MREALFFAENCDGEPLTSASLFSAPLALRLVASSAEGLQLLVGSGSSALSQRHDVIDLGIASAFEVATAPLALIAIPFDHALSLLALSATTFPPVAVLRTASLL